VNAALTSIQEDLGWEESRGWKTTSRLIIILWNFKFD
jgi:hypothetical protein